MSPGDNNTQVWPHAPSCGQDLGSQHLALAIKHDTFEIFSRFHPKYFSVRDSVRVVTTHEFKLILAGTGTISELVVYWHNVLC